MRFHLSSRSLFRWGAGLLLLASALLAATAGAEELSSTEGPELPPADCLRAIRAARIAGLGGDAEGELAGLRAAREAFPGELSVLSALLSYHRRHPLPPEEHQGLTKEVEAALAEVDRPAPIAVVKQVIADPDTGSDLLSSIGDHLRRRLAVQESPDPKLLWTLSEVQDRLGDEDGALASLEGLWRLGGHPELVFVLDRSSSIGPQTSRRALARSGSPVR